MTQPNPYSSASSGLAPDASLSAAGADAAAPAPRGLPLGLAGSMLGLGAVLLAGAAAYGLATWWGNAAQWVAALAAALGVLLAALPLGWLVWTLARSAPPADAPATTVPAVGQSHALFHELAQREWARARRYGSGAALLLVDVDRFARLCEARGDNAGDAALDALLRQIAPTLRGADLLTRLAPSQVAVFLVQADATGALDVAERIRDRAEQLEVAFQQPGGGQVLRLTVSVGVAQLRPQHQQLQALIDDAEEAVAGARQAGGNCVRAAPLEPARDKPPGSSWRERRARPKQDGSGD